MNFEQMIKNFDETTFAPYEQMLCDEIGAYCHTVATIRSHAIETCNVALFERFNELHVKSFAHMTMMYFNDCDETLQYLIENY